jgi:hypothetical protein
MSWGQQLAASDEIRGSDVSGVCVAFPDTWHLLPALGVAARPSVKRSRGLDHRLAVIRNYEIKTPFLRHGGLSQSGEFRSATANARGLGTRSVVDESAIAWAGPRTRVPRPDLAVHACDGAVAHAATGSRPGAPLRSRTRSAYRASLDACVHDENASDGFRGRLQRPTVKDLRCHRAGAYAT